MPSVVVTVPQFPNVPQLPGVPQLLRAAVGFATVLSIPPTVQPAGIPGVLWQAAQSAPVWGVFDASGNKVIDSDSVIDFNYRQEYSISDYPVQDDAFASYNKVKHPGEMLVRLVKGSSLADRVSFEAQCEAVADSLTLYTIYTPEKRYQNVNVLRHEVNRREARGANYIEADLFFRVINTVQAQYSSTGNLPSPTANAASPSAIPPVSNGVVQPITPSDLDQKLLAELKSGSILQ